MKTKTQVSDRTPEGLATKLLRENKEGGTIFLSDFRALLPGDTEKSTVIHALKNNKEGVYISGRHGRPSRWVYGPMRNEVAQEETEYVATAVSTGVNHRRSVRGKDLEIKISIGNQEGIITFNKMDLMSDVLAAA